MTTNNQPYTGSTIADCGRAVDAVMSEHSHSHECPVCHGQYECDYSSCHEPTIRVCPDCNRANRPDWTEPFDAMIEAIWGQP